MQKFTITRVVLTAGVLTVMGSPVYLTSPKVLTKVRVEAATVKPTFQDQGQLTYSLDSTNLTAEVSGFSGTAGSDVVIPDEITCNGVNYAVTSVGAYAFSNTGIHSVVIGNNVVDINTSAFQTTSAFPDFYKKALTEVILGEKVQNIKTDAFAGNALTSIVLPDSVVKIATRAFSNNALAEVSFSAQVTDVMSKAFQNNQLTRISFAPEAQTVVGSAAFSGSPVQFLALGTGVTLADDALNKSSLLYQQLADMPTSGLRTVEVLADGSLKKSWEGQDEDSSLNTPEGQNSETSSSEEEESSPTAQEGVQETGEAPQQESTETSVSAPNDLPSSEASQDDTSTLDTEGEGQASASNADNIQISSKTIQNSLEETGETQAQDSTETSASVPSDLASSEAPQDDVSVLDTGGEVQASATDSSVKTDGSIGDQTESDLDDTPQLAQQEETTTPASLGSAQSDLNLKENSDSQQQNEVLGFEGASMSENKTDLDLVNNAATQQSEVTPDSLGGLNASEGSDLDKENTLPKEGAQASIGEMIKQDEKQSLVGDLTLEMGVSVAESVGDTAIDQNNLDPAAGTQELKKPVESDENYAGIIPKEVGEGILETFTDVLDTQAGNRMSEISQPRLATQQGEFKQKEEQIIPPEQAADAKNSIGSLNLESTSQTDKKVLENLSDVNYPAPNAKMKNLTTSKIETGGRYHAKNDLADKNLLTDSAIATEKLNHVDQQPEENADGLEILLTKIPSVKSLVKDKLKVLNLPLPAGAVPAIVVKATRENADENFVSEKGESSTQKSTVKADTDEKKIGNTAEPANFVPLTPIGTKLFQLANSKPTDLFNPDSQQKSTGLQHSRAKINLVLLVPSLVLIALLLRLRSSTRRNKK
ncbi:leucine-rich repeat domain-containing protein [Lactococcus kimchii]|uniref:leucine-rich repeat domain-containing protein n=1 Tax=Lactococcus sp. S-13 TaxID=2507158 RepID=UPI001023866E|nr:leucine-rich repeat domain-containing protein [Lactococcus sp. S-13]RZI48853.1 hypothetical protein EQJ87_05040 [Lactococcus sp. S-13]